MDKKVLAIHDISAYGKCSLTVALPIISTCGAECVVLPTSLLSTHTGGFTGFTFLDLTDEMRKITAHWKTLGLKFDAIYTGYLGSFEQIDLVKEIIRDFSDEHTLVVVDPVMADNGKFYSLFNQAFADKMAELVAESDVFIPNLTEASFLLHENYDTLLNDNTLEELLKKLQKLNNGDVVITGIEEDGLIGSIALDRRGNVTNGRAKKIDGMYHGTGDVFGSAFVGAMLKSNDLARSCQLACDYTSKCAETTFENGTPMRNGVAFEHNTPYLCSLIEKL